MFEVLRDHNFLSVSTRSKSKAANFLCDYFVHKFNCSYDISKLRRLTKSNFKLINKCVCDIITRWNLCKFDNSRFKKTYSDWLNEIFVLE